MKKVPKQKAVFSFCSKHKPAEHVSPKEKILLYTEDAFGGQANAETASIEKLDWSKVDGATGPIFINGAEPGDTLIVNIEKIKMPKKGVIAAIPKQGALQDKNFKSAVKIISIRDGYIHFENRTKIKANPMIGTIGVAPATTQIPTGTSGKHGGNMDVKNLTAGTKLYLPVFVKGALLAAGDLHAVQADGEICVSAVEISGEILLSFDLLKGRSPSWPILETRDSYALIACGDSLDEASIFAVEAAVEALMREYEWTFEKAYMFASLVVNLEINQVVDPKKGVRAVISKKYISADSLFSKASRHSTTG